MQLPMAVPPSSPPRGVLAEARALRPALKARRREVEDARRVPVDVAEQLAAAGFYRMLVPAEAGGGEVTPRELVLALAELARGDAAVAWVAMTGATTGLCTAYLDGPGRDALGGDPRARFAGVFAPAGRAVPVEGGFRLTGRWPFSSGCENATWFLGGALVDVGEGPVHRAFFLPADALEVHPTWDVAGLLGTGSHDTSVSDHFVPAAHVCALVGGTPRVPAALYAFPVFGLLAAGVAAVALGIAEAAVEEAAEEAGRRAKREVFQRAYARASGEVAAGRAALLMRLDEGFAAASEGAAIDLRQRAQLRLAAAHAVRAAARAVDALYEASGGAAIYRRHPLQRHFRDVHTVTQHVMVAAGAETLAARVLLGQPAPTEQL